MPNAIMVSALGKQFRRRHIPTQAWTLLELFLGLLRRTPPVEVPWTLLDVSFSVEAGVTLGVIGHNGAGKSSLLRLIGGIGRPSRGNIAVHGRIGGLLNLNAGFNEELTGRENIFVAGVIAGLTRREVAQRFDAIVEFAELEQVIDNTLRTYSTGMQMRLGFAIAFHAGPEILLIDEVLAVGDREFQEKCLDRIVRLKQNGCTIILVSHDLTLVHRLCDEVLWLHNGRLREHGATELVVDRYVADMKAETRRRTPASRPAVRTATGTELKVNENRFGSLELEITSVRLLDVNGAPAAELSAGNPLRVEINYMAPEPFAAPIFTVTITREDALVCYDTSTAAAALTLPTVQGPGKVVLHLERIDLNDGLYFVDVGAYKQDWSYAYDYHSHVYPLIIRSGGGHKGILRPPHRWEMEVEQSIGAGLPELKAT